MTGRRVLLIVSGGIAAYKTLDLIRRLRDAGIGVRCVLTNAGARFVTPLSLAALSGEPVQEDLFDPGAEATMGHIALSRAADLVVVAPATADLMARMAAGLANDLATTLLLATDTPVLIAPAMNPRMWSHPATQANLATLEARGVQRIGPNSGDMACGEDGEGRMAEVPEILAAVLAHPALAPSTDSGPDADATPNPTPPPSLAGRHALVTSGPTHEPIDPVRYIANRSSGRQGHAIAAALAALGARVTLVSGPTQEPDPAGVQVRRVTTARDMLAAAEEALPADVAVCAAAVADWRVADPAGQKMKKPTAEEGGRVEDGQTLSLTLVQNPDILASLSAPGPRRPRLVVGFAAETENVVAQATAKRRRKGCDWILANDVSESGNGGRGGVFGGAENTIHLVTDQGVEDWPTLSKDAVAHRLALRVARAFDPVPPEAETGDAPRAQAADAAQ